jgi:hypothetical protein
MGVGPLKIRSPRRFPLPTLVTKNDMFACWALVTVGKPSATRAAVANRKHTLIDEAILGSPEGCAHGCWSPVTSAGRHHGRH